jgi:hypothetical protein
MNNLDHRPRCGACQTIIEDGKDFNAHIKSCVPAQSILPIYMQIMAGNDSTGHQSSYILRQAHHNRHLIDRYAATIAYESSTLDRVDAHIRLCEKLSIERDNFKPFECESIQNLPSFDEAKDIIWKALFKAMWNELQPVKDFYKILNEK